MPHMEHFAWLAPLIVAAVNLALTGRLLTLKENIMKESRETFEPRESCSLRHEALEHRLIQIEPVARPRVA